MPYLRRAEQAADKIDPKDITEIRGNKNPRDTVKLIFDTVQILFQGPLCAVAPKNYDMKKMQTPFIEDSYAEHAVKLMTPEFCKNL